MRMCQADVDTINRMLADKYGTDVITGLPIWRVVWAADQTEKRLEYFTPEGIELLYPQVMEFPKYSWIKDHHILERLVQVPHQNEDELIQKKISYELLFRFWDKNEEYLPPNFLVCEIVIETVLAAQHRTGNLAKYVIADPHTKEARRKRLEEIKEYLWGDQSSLGGSTYATKESVAYTGEPKISANGVN